MSATNEQTAPIRVFDPCNCQACTQDRPWFACLQIQARHVITYLCDPIGPDDPRIPHPAHIAWVRGQHPTAVLVYLDA